MTRTQKTILALPFLSRREAVGVGILSKYIRCTDLVCGPHGQVLNAYKILEDTELLNVESTD